MLKRIIGLSFCLLVWPYLASTQVNPFTHWLALNNDSLSISFNQHDYQLYNKVLNSKIINITKLGAANINIEDSKWLVTTKATKSTTDSNAYNLSVVFKCVAGILPQSSVSVNIQSNNWSANNYVLMPAVAYNGNRYEWRKLRYSPKLYEVQDIGPHKPIILTNVPKLNEADGFSRIQERSGSMSLPSVGYQANEKNKGFWLVTGQKNEWGDYGFTVSESRDRKKATISLTSPLCREFYSYQNVNAYSPSMDRPANFKAGDVVSFELQLYDFQAPTIQSLFDKYCDINANNFAKDNYANVTSFSQAYQTIEKKFNQYNFVPSFGYYAVGLRENYMQDWQIGWTGGMISTYGLLFSDKQQTRANVIRNFDWLFPNGISPSGFYWDAGQNGDTWIGGDIRKPQTKDWHLIRKSGDAVFYIVKQFMLMQHLGISVKKQWETGNKVVCDAFVKLWNKNHQIGQFVNSNTGEIEVGGSTSGAIVPAALALASVYYNNPNYLQTAIDIADYYNQQFVKKGIACGGPGDALQNFDSESAFSLVESYVTLFELTHDKKWLRIAENSANQFASWVVAYNYDFPKNSDFAKLEIKTKGAVYANTQNKHAAPGVCINSGSALLKLYEYTDNYFYLNLLKSMAKSITQYVPTDERKIGSMKNGFVSERVNLSDWEGEDRIGAILPISTWAETTVMLTAQEVPGIYVDLKHSKYTVIDNIAVSCIKKAKGAITLQITNPFNEAIEVKARVRKDFNSNKNLFFPVYQVIHLKARETKRVSFK